MQSQLKMASKRQYSAGNQGRSDFPDGRTSKGNDRRGDRVMVGENREHFSLLQTGRRQMHQKHKRTYRTLQETAVLGHGGEPTSGDELEGEDGDNHLQISMINRISAYFRLVCKRFPRGKCVLLVLTLTFLEAFVFTGVLTEVRRLLPSNSCQHCKTDWESFVLSLLYSSFGRVFYPVAGVIADSYLGRYRVINIGFWLLWAGFAVSGLSFSLLRLIPKALVARKACDYIVAVVVVILFSSGSGSVEATLIPFGADQLAQGSSSDEISAYFHYYYISRNVAGLMMMFVLFVVFDKISFIPHSNDSSSKAYHFNSDSDYITQNVVSTLAVSFALLLLFYFRNKFYKEKQQSNALKSVSRVLCFAARVKRRLPQRNRAFRYGGGWTPRIDLAKIENDGSFEGEEVEEVKTFYRMLLLMLSLFGYFITYGAGFAYMTSTLRTATLKVMPEGHKLHYLANNMILIVNTGAISIALPIINHLLIPIRPTINIRLKVGLGFLLHVLSFGVAGLIHWNKVQSHLHDTTFLGWMFFAAVLLSVGETIVYVSSLEFIYAQSPNNMKGLQIGIFYLIYGVFSAVGSTIYYSYLTHYQNELYWPLFCIILMSIGIVGLVVYGMVAFCYKNRQRPATDEADVQRRLMYANVYDSKS